MRKDSPSLLRRRRNPSRSPDRPTLRMLTMSGLSERRHLGAIRRSRPAVILPCLGSRTRRRQQARARVRCGRPHTSARCRQLEVRSGKKPRSQAIREDAAAVSSCNPRISREKASPQCPPIRQPTYPSSNQHRYPFLLCHILLLAGHAGTINRRRPSNPRLGGIPLFYLRRPV